MAASHKAAGNKFYGDGEWSAAIEEYGKGIELLTESSSADLNDDDKAVLAACYNNAAQCRMKLEAYEKAVEDCTSCLAVDPGNLKAMLRRATCFEKLKEYSAALKDLNDYDQIKPGQKTVNKMKARLRRAIQKQKMLPAKGSGGSSGGAGGAGYRSSVGAPPSGGGRGSGVAKFSDGVQLQGLNNEDMEYLVEMQNVIKRTQRELALIGDRSRIANNELRKAQLTQKEITTNPTNSAYLPMGKCFRLATPSEVEKSLKERVQAASDQMEFLKRQQQALVKEGTDAQEGVKLLIKRVRSRETSS